MLTEGRTAARSYRTDLTCARRNRSHDREDTQDIDKMHPRDIADAVRYLVARECRLAVNESAAKAAEQTW
jgi:NADP-dependent 3-hydroxy acid dehydrogenase YdfG